MDSDDTFEEFQRVAVTGAAALSRAAEVLIRNAQDAKVRQTARTAQVTEDLQRRAEAQAAAAERYYAHATEPEWVRQASAAEVATAWKGVHQWAEVDPHRFSGLADALDDRLQDEYGIAPTSLTATRTTPGDSLRTQALSCEEQITAHRDRQHHPDADGSGDLAAAEARDAREKADYLTGYDPQTIAAATRKHRGHAAAASGRVPMRTPGRDEERGD